MRWVFVSLHDVYKPTSGGSVASCQILRALVAAFGSDCITFTYPERDGFARALGVPTIFHSRPRAAREQILGFLTNQRDRTTVNVVENLKAIREFQPDFVFLDGGLLSATSGVFRGIGVPIVAFHHNDEEEYRYEAAASRQLAPFLASDARDQQLIVIGNAKINLTFTDRDAARLSERSGKSVVAVGFGEPVSVASPFSESREVGAIAVTGEFSMRKGARGLIELLSYINLINKNEVSVYKCYISGSGISESARLLAARGGHEVVEKSVAFSRAAIYVNPSDLPGGIKIRSCDALRNGLRLVTHRNSLPGFEGLGGNVVNSYSSFNQFVHALGLAAQAAKRDRPSLIREIYAKEFSTDAFAARLRNVIVSGLE